ncbi:MAG: hypothetical protein FWG59_03875, partial [Betaproteobacteria bacterium]|nr:hypothetical protein [Betaproteobacteria bacterium]
MRIAQRTIYNNMLNNMQSTLGAYMESNIQASSQKKVNRPSDDPAGTARIMNYRASLEMNKQQSNNVDTATGWLNLGDDTLMQVSTVITRLKELAEQASTGTYTPENRLQISYEIRAQFNQLINLANTKFEDQHIFGGQKYDISAYQEGLGITTGDSALGYEAVNWKVDGDSARSIMVRFPADASIDATGAMLDASGNPAPIAYEWSDDGGSTWNTGTMTAGTTPGTNVLTAGGAQITIPQPAASVNFTHYEPDSADNPEGFNGFNNGTQLIIRPAAYYMGDDNDAPQVIESFGAIPTADCTSVGNFSGDVRIRIDPNPFDPTISSYSAGDTAYFSYSTDNGLTWTASQVTVAASPDKTRFIVPGGFLDVDVDGGLGQIGIGQQFAIRPHRANLGYEIMPGEYMDVNNVGKDIFGGLYQTPDMKYSDPPVAAQPVFGDGDARNLFEVVSRLIAFTECNNQSGVQQCLEDLTTAQQTVLTAATKIGGKENRLDITKQVLDSQKLDQQQRLSYVEDVDLTELLTRLSQQ